MGGVRSKTSSSIWRSADEGLGVILIGAQQTASQIERRVVGNCAFRVVVGWTWQRRSMANMAFSRLRAELELESETWDSDRLAAGDPDSSYGTVPIPAGYAA